MLNIVLQYNTLIILEDDTSYSCQGIVANRFFLYFQQEVTYYQDIRNGASFMMRPSHSSCMVCYVT